MLYTIWIVIEHRKIKAMWTKDCIQSFKSWKKAMKACYPEGYMTYKNIVIN